jgi:glucose/arabinose dehydrogenase
MPMVRLSAAAVAVLVCASHAEAQLSARVHASGFSSPVAFVQDPVSSNVQYVVEQAGSIRVVRDGVVLATDFLDLRGAISSGGERGLLGMAFDPGYLANRRFYVNFTNPSGHTVVARFTRSSADPLVADPSSRFDLRWNGPSGPPLIDQPFSNHNGGHLAFGPDGYLYIGLGDGGSGNDPGHLAQNPASLLGKMLRLDVNVPDGHDIGYVVPSDNPFLDGSPVAARGEIWAFGLRNPWRYSFDDPSRGGTGALIIGDVGQGAWEEVSYEPAGRGGRNYGWRNREGAHNNVTSLPPAYQPLIDPIHEYDHNTGSSISGGHVYRGRQLGASMRGRYFFADFIRSRVWSIGLAINSSGEASVTNVTEHTTELGGSAQLANVASFGVDSEGELYIVSYSRGVILKIVGPAPKPSAPTGLRIVR